MFSFNSFLAHPATPKSVNLEDKGEWNFQTMHAICPCMVWKTNHQEKNKLPRSYHFWQRQFRWHIAAVNFLYDDETVNIVFLVEGHFLGIHWLYTVRKMWNTSKIYCFTVGVNAVCFSVGKHMFCLRFPAQNINLKYKGYVVMVC